VPAAKKSKTVASAAAAVAAAGDDAKMAEAAVHISEERRMDFSRKLTRWFRSKRIENAPVDDALAAVNAASETPFSRGEANRLLVLLEAMNIVMVRGNTVTIILVWVASFLCDCGVLHFMYLAVCVQS
jgi:hypothetical protein